MSNIPDNRSKEFLKLIRTVEQRLSEYNQPLTINKTKVLEVLFESDDHLSVEDIIQLSNHNDKKLTVTTVYRILSSFEHYGIVDSITVLDRKRYELSYKKQPHYHLYCLKCGSIVEFDDIDIHDRFLKELSNVEFEPVGFNVIINGVCKKCQAQ